MASVRSLTVADIVRSVVAESAESVNFNLYYVDVVRVCVGGRFVVWGSGETERMSQTRRNPLSLPCRLFE